MRSGVTLGVLLGLAMVSWMLAACGRDGDSLLGSTSAYVLASGEPGSTDDHAARVIVRLAKRQHPYLHVDVHPTAGSIENARRLSRGEADFAILHSDIATYAREGRAMFERHRPDSGIFAVANLYPEYVQIAARIGAKIQSVQDLAGKRVAVQTGDAGSRHRAAQILQAAGLSVQDLASMQEVDTRAARQLLQDEQLDAVFLTASVGHEPWRDIFYTLPDHLQLVPVDSVVRERLLRVHPWYREAVVPADSYAGQIDDVPTVSLMVMLVAREGVPANDVHSMLEGIFNYLTELQEDHPHLRAVNFRDAQDRLTVPLHPGADAFYRVAVAIEPVAQQEQVPAGASSEAAP